MRPALHGMRELPLPAWRHVATVQYQDALETRMSPIRVPDASQATKC